MSTTLTVSSKGQVAIPREYRDALGLSKGTKVKISLESDGTLVMKPIKNSISNLFGCLGKTKHGTLTVEDMDAAIEEEMRKKFP
jgi:AbrB family looped-hinge helix DNA binding protein